MSDSPLELSKRFRGFMPVIVDVETGGFNARTDALLEIAAVMVRMDPSGRLQRARTLHHHVEPFRGANIQQESLEVNGIDPHHPLRGAVPEQQALSEIFRDVRAGLRFTDCTRAVLVGHNAFFDLNFLNSAVERTGIKRNPFHPFSCFDTVTLAALAYGQTVLAKAVLASGQVWDTSQAHSAIYDAERTADLFCDVINRWQGMGGWPLS